MESYSILGYAYDADMHCLSCTLAQHPDPDNAIDNEGNDLHPIFADYVSDDDYCGDCFANLLTGDLPAWVETNPDHYLALTGLHA